jgi:hypothetical protein
MRIRCRDAYRGASAVTVVRVHPSTGHRDYEQQGTWRRDLAARRSRSDPSPPVFRPRVRFTAGRYPGGDVSGTAGRASTRQDVPALVLLNSCGTHTQRSLIRPSPNDAQPVATGRQTTLPAPTLST